LGQDFGVPAFLQVVLVMVDVPLLGFRCYPLKRPEGRRGARHE